MQIPRSQYVAAVDILDLPCFVFSGEGLSRSDGEPFDKDAFARDTLQEPARPFAESILEIASSPDSDGQLPDPIIVPLTIFGLDTSPTVFTIPAVGKVKINLGAYLALRSVPITASWLQSLYIATEGPISFESIDQVPIPSYSIDELEWILRWWLRLQEEGRFDVGEIDEILAPTLIAPEAELAYEVIDQMFEFISFHEFAHWYGTRIPVQELAQLIDRMRSYLRTWSTEDSLTDPVVRENVAELFADHPQVLENWVQELHADALAVQFCQKHFAAHHGVHGSKLRMRVFAAQAMVYYLFLFLNEIFYESVVKKPLDWGTHPPAGLRVNIFCYVGARLQGKSLVEFATQDWAVGTLIGLVVERLILELKDRIAAW